MSRFHRGNRACAVPSASTRRLSRRAFLRGGLTGGAILVAGPALAPALVRALEQGESIEQAAYLRSILTREFLESLIRNGLAQGGSFCDVFGQYAVQRSLRFSEDKLQNSQVGVVSGVGVRVVENDKTGYAYSSVLEEEALRKAAENARAVTIGSGALPPRKLARGARPDYIKIRIPAEQVVEDRKLELVRAIHDAARAYDPAVQQVDVTYEESSDFRMIANSQGIFVEDTLPMLTIRVYVRAGRNGSSGQGHKRFGGRIGMELFETFTTERMGQLAAHQAVTMLDAQPAPAGPTTVVISNQGGVLFHEAIGHGLEADSIRKNVSFFTGRIGETVASPLITLVDDATLANARGSFNADDDGVPGQRSVLIEKGRLVGTMSDQHEALLGHSLSSGNGRRQDYRHASIPRMSNTYVLPGTAKPEDIIGQTAKGIYARSFGGGMVDTSSGQFTFLITEGYLIEQGKITTPVRGASLVGNGIDILRNTDMVADDLDHWLGTCGKGGQWVPVTAGTPTLRISSITVGGTG